MLYEVTCSLRNFLYYCMLRYSHPVPSDESLSDSYLLVLLARSSSLCCCMAICLALKPWLLTIVSLGITSCVSLRNKCFVRILAFGLVISNFRMTPLFMLLVLHSITRACKLTIVKDSSFRRGLVSNQDMPSMMMKIAVLDVSKPTIR